ncbi:uncharacterized protein [Drosophila suzukii]|uniref:RNA-directed DNA polymerase n=1 Tax=Drosophila suzukii TaxID=28584 RepID=A0ABM4TXL6_DROSZ
MFVRSQRNIKDWASLKSALVEEFGIKLSSAEVHRRLGKRQQHKGELLHEFLYALMEIAKPICLEKESLIEYFVEGIPDARSNKAMLYQARNLKDLKLQIDAYQKSRGSSKPVNKYGLQGSKALHDTKQDALAESVRKCVRCGDSSHMKKHCPVKEKCFKCDQPGHRAAQCKAEVQVKTERATNVVQDDKVVSQPSRAELCLMRRRMFLKLGVGVGSLMGRQRVLTGIGESQVLTFGSFVTKVVIDGIDMSVEFHVIPDDDMKFDAILGTTILISVDMMVTKYGTIFSPRVLSVQQRPMTGSYNNQAGQSTCLQLISEFESLCMISTKDSKTVSAVDLEHLSQENPQKYTSFVTQSGQYEFLFVPFGITNSPAVFTSFIMAVMRDSIKNEDAVVYMDDVIISSKSIDEGVQKLKRVLEVAQGNGLRVNWSKCQVLKRKVNFLGYVVENGTINPGNEKTQAVADFPIPRDKKGVQRFQGLTSYFRRFVEGYAVIAKPLSDMLRKEVRFEFQDQQLGAFKKLKEALISGPVLKLYNHSLDTEIHTDASKFGFGAVLLQRDPCDNLWHPVFYMSRKSKPLNEVLFKDPNKELLVVPSLMETEIIQNSHKQGHFSSKKTQDLIEKSFYIPKLKEKVARVVDSCVECILVNAKAGRQEGFLTPIDKGDKPLVTYHVDHVDPMEFTKKRYNHIFEIVDAFSKSLYLDIPFFH